MAPRPRSFLLPLSFILVLVAGFSAGVHLDRLGLVPGSPYYAPAHVGKDFDPFWEAWQLVEEYYVDRDKVRPKTMTEGAIEGMLDTLGDLGHTTYLNAKEAKEMAESLAGKLEGIGAGITVRQKRPTITQTFPGSPARKVGLRPGDAILEVDGKPVSNLPLDQVVKLVRGPAGSAVHLKVAREGDSKVHTFDIRRARVDVPAIAWAMLPGHPIAHVALREFGTNADKELRTALADLRKAGAKGVIFDVRANPGGLKDQAVAVTSEFLKDGTVFLEQDAQGHRAAIPVKPGGTATDLPLVVLIDGGSASSAEIFAGAIQDHKRGKLVGTRTFGTGTVLGSFELSDGSVVLLAIAQWFTPNGRKIWHEGIRPDIDVDMPEGASYLFPEQEAELTPAALAKSEDRQLVRALQVLQQQLAGGN